MYRVLLYVVFCACMYLEHFRLIHPFSSKFRHNAKFLVIIRASPPNDNQCRPPPPTSQQAYTCNKEFFYTIHIPTGTTHGRLTTFLCKLKSQFLVWISQLLFESFRTFLRCSLVDCSAIWSHAFDRMMSTRPVHSLLQSSRALLTWHATRPLQKYFFKIAATLYADSCYLSLRLLTSRPGSARKYFQILKSNQARRRPPARNSVDLGKTPFPDRRQFELLVIRVLVIKMLSTYQNVDGRSLSPTKRTARQKS